MSFDDRKYISLDNPHNPIADQKFVVYPNPATNQLNISYQSLSENATTVFELYNIMGAKVMSMNLPNNKTLETIDVDALNNGIYFYKIVYNNNLLQSNKIIILK